MIAVGVVIVSFIIITVLTAEYRWWGGAGARVCIRFAVRVQRSANRARFDEEWRRNLEDLACEQGHPGLLWALGMALKAPLVRLTAKIEAEIPVVINREVGVMFDDHVMWSVEGGIEKLDRHDKLSFTHLLSNPPRTDADLMLPSGKRVIVRIGHPVTNPGFNPKAL